MAAGQDSGPVGEVAADEAFRILGEEPAAQIVDVRTRAEWSFVGVPDLSAIGKEPVLAEWQRYPDMSVAPDFVDAVAAELKARGADEDTTVLFICRSGARSLSSANALARAGWRRCVNVSGGFEGPSDGERHRGHVDGWKAKGLPWIQS